MRVADFRAKIQEAVDKVGGYNLRIALKRRPDKYTVSKQFNICVEWLEGADLHGFICSNFWGNANPLTLIKEDWQHVCRYIVNNIAQNK
jgi:hypothetical protein